MPRDYSPRARSPQAPGPRRGGGGGILGQIFGSNNARKAEAGAGARTEDPEQVPRSNAQRASSLADAVLTSTLRRGSKGSQVEALQRLLGIGVDGDFGGGTERAVKAWQRRHGLEDDGVVGKDTRETLMGGGGSKPKAELPKWAREEDDKKTENKKTDSSAPTGKKNPPKGALKSRHQDDEKFVPGYAATAYSESSIYRKESDPYAVGAISKPTQEQDYGGKTYGTYQFESFVYRDGTAASTKLKDNSTVMRFLRSAKNPFGAQLLEVVTEHGIASAEFDAAWKALTAKSNKAFGEAQEAFMEEEVKEKVNAWFDTASVAASVRKDPRLFDLVVGTLNQYSSLAERHARAVAAAQKEAERSLTADEVGVALQESKWGAVETNFKSSPKAWEGIYNRVNREGAMFKGYEAKDNPSA